MSERWLANNLDPATEAIEADVPVVVLRKEYVPDTAGPGAHRGGAAVLKDTLWLSEAEHWSSPLHTKKTSGFGVHGGRRPGPLRTGDCIWCAFAPVPDLVGAVVADGPGVGYVAAGRVSGVGPSNGAGCQHGGDAAVSGRPAAQVGVDVPKHVAHVGPPRSERLRPHPLVVGQTIPEHVEPLDRRLDRGPGAIGLWGKPLARSGHKVVA